MQLPPSIINYSSFTNQTANFNWLLGQKKPSFQENSIPSPTYNLKPTLTTIRPQIPNHQSEEENHSSYQKQQAGADQQLQRKNGQYLNTDTRYKPSYTYSDKSQDYSNYKPYNEGNRYSPSTYTDDTDRYRDEPSDYNQMYEDLWYNNRRPNYNWRQQFQQMYNTPRLPLRPPPPAARFTDKPHSAVHTPQPKTPPTTPDAVEKQQLPAMSAGNWIDLLL